MNSTNEEAILFILLTSWPTSHLRCGQWREGRN